MKKYNKNVTKQDILDLFKEKEVVTRKDIIAKYNCSKYLIYRLIDDLKDDDLIIDTRYKGYILKN